MGTQFWLNKNDSDEGLQSGTGVEFNNVDLNSSDSLVGAVEFDGDNKFVPLIPAKHSMHQQKVSYKSVFLKIWKIALSVFLVFYVTLLAFPGLLVGIESQYSSIQRNAWMPVILTT